MVSHSTEHMGGELSKCERVLLPGDSSVQSVATAFPSIDLPKVKIKSSYFCRILVS